MDETGKTVQFSKERDGRPTAEEVLLMVYKSMREKGYDPVNQMVGYLISGDPTYITSHNNARYFIKKLERDELIEELVRSYLETNKDLI